MKALRYVSPRRPLVWGAALAALLLAGVDARGDDRDLLRFNTAKPYVFILLDTSGSMTLAPNGSWLPASGDDPGSRIYQAKEALYEVFSNVNDIHLGFATYNQDDLHIRAKHWLYTVDPVDPLNPVRQRFTLPSGAEFPATGELLTLGSHFATGTPGVAGDCKNPLSLATARDKINRFAKLGVDGLQVTTLWISEAGKTYRLRVGPDSGQALGSAGLSVFMRLTDVPDCNLIPGPNVGTEFIVSLSLVQEFLMRDLVPGSGEPSAGFWPWEDAATQAACGDGTPFSGQGWEGNYDTALDRHCQPPNNSNQCRNLKHATQASSIAPELDLGDVIPLHWNVDNLDTFLDRLAPDRLDGTPDFRAAPYFTDMPDTLGLALKQSGQRPIVAGGADSPLGKAIADFRCWYLGRGANKCNNFGAPEGWEEVAKDEDTEWGCRRPYLIVVGDGGDSCKGENPCADTANMFSKAGIRSWVITYGGTAQPPLSCIAENGRGELVFVSDKDSLADELRRVLGLIREESSTFASAAAPSTQRVVDRTVYVSTFTPINSRSRWDGHLDSFLKPLPLTIDREPDRTAPQFQWDAGQQMLLQAPDQAAALAGNLQLGRGEAQRRIFYSMERTGSGRVQPGAWPSQRRGLFWTDDATGQEIRYDLWEGLRVPFARDVSPPPPGQSGVDQTAQNRANKVLSSTVAIQQATVDGSLISYVLGDIFHSDPLVLAAPSNPRLFAEDAESDGSACSAGNPGYRCFFRKHQFRRKQLLLGSNDGMLHAIDAGRAAVVTNAQGNDEVRFDEGTGREIWAYMPRAVMPSVRRLAEGTSHLFTVDSAPVAADVFIDPVYTLGAPNPAEREFRTVAITGLREGGASYFALDITQPDTIGNDGVPTPLAGPDAYVPSCVANSDNLEATPVGGCGPVPYPAPLWEFNDSAYDPATRSFLFLDENADGIRDLGDTWSPVSVGRIPICEGSECDPTVPNNNVRDLWVAVFSGGMDPAQARIYDPRDDPPDDDDPPLQLRGDWLFMVDIETGKTIYKRQLLVDIGGVERSAGSAPGGAAAVDTDQDGYLDRVYVGTVGGYLFRVDLDLESDGDAHTLVDVTVPATHPFIGTVLFTQQRIPLTDGGGNPIWKPRPIFSANFDSGQATTAPRPLYHEPSVIFVAELGRYALAFGSGDREDLWAGNDQEGRFYVFVDETDLLDDSALPLDESDFASIDVGAAQIGADLLTTRGVGQKGWFLNLDADERVITDAFSLAGVTFFSSFQPDVEVSGGRDPLCSKTGISRIFIVNTTNANAFLATDTGRSRFMYASTFVTQPYTEQGSNSNPVGGSGGGGGSPPPPGPTADDLTDQLKQVMEEMKDLFPSDCKFANYRIDIKTLTADTGVVFIAPVPVCLIERNWKEF